MINRIIGVTVLLSMVIALLLLFRNGTVEELSNSFQGNLSSLSNNLDDFTFYVPSIPKIPVLFKNFEKGGSIIGAILGALLFILDGLIYLVNIIISVINILIMALNFIIKILTIVVVFVVALFNWVGADFVAA